jgi:hypothetical protein
MFFYDPGSRFAAGMTKCDASGVRHELVSLMKLA